MHRRAVALFGLLVATTSPAPGQTVSIDFQDGVSPARTLPSGTVELYQGTSDTIIKDGGGVTASNFGQLDQLRVINSDIGTLAPTRTLIRWDLSAFVPPGSVVQSAVITLNVETAGSTPNIHQLLKPWVEGDGTPGSGATWIEYAPPTDWASPGTGGNTGTSGDRGAAITTFPGNATGLRALTFSGGAGLAMVQAWVDDPAENHGVILVNATNGVNFTSREGATPTLRPRLTVTFAPPAVATSTQQTVTFRDGLALPSGPTYAGTTDTYMDSDTANQNFGASNLLQLDNNDITRALFRWDVSFIPPGSTIQAVSVVLHVETNGSNFDFYELVRPWVETQATWNLAATGDAWGTAGANNTGGNPDRGTTLLGTLVTTASDANLTTVLNASGQAVVKGWVDDPSVNRGLILGSTGGTGLTTVRSREWTAQDERPALVVTFTPPSSGVLKQIAGGASWTNPAAWSPSGVPAAGDSVQINGPGTVTLASGAHTVARIETRDGGALHVTGGSVTVSGLSWFSGDLTVAAGASYTGRGPFRLLHTARLTVPGGTVRVGTGAANTCWLGGSLVGSASGVLEGETGAASLEVRGGAALNGFTVRRGDQDGLHVYPTARLERLRACRFEVHQAGGRYLTIEQRGPFSLSAPGCFFGAITSGNNVRLVDTSPGADEDVVLNLEDRGTGVNGAGVGAARESELGGASINWVRAAPDTTAGKATGFPQTAWDLDTFAEYATYVAFRDVNPDLDDRVHVFDPDGSGTDRGYWFQVPQTAGDIVGYPWWDQIAGQRVVWVATTTGRLFRFDDPGSGSGAVAAAAGYPVTLSNATFTTPPLTTDSTRVYLAGTRSGAPRVFAFVAATGALAWELATGLPDPISSELSSESLFGTTRLFVGGGAALPGGGVVLLSQNFSANQGPFAYQDDTFRGTSGSGSFASGNWANNVGNPGGGLRVRLGPSTTTLILTDLSGGWGASFNVPAGGSTPVRVDVNYRLVSNSEFEFDEFQDLLVSLDGVLVGSGANDFVFRHVGDENGGPNMDSGWRTFSFVRQLAPGPHTLVLGGYMNKSTQPEEIVECFFDNVTVQTSPTVGRIYRVNANSGVVDLQDQTPFAPVVAAPFPAFQTGLFVGDTSGTVHGVEHTNSMTPLGGWPVQAGSSPVQGSVWLDYLTQQVFWGNEEGAVHGYTVGGAALPNFPIAGALGDGAGIRHATSDSGALWVGSERGRLRKFAVGSGAGTGPLYRFGSAAAVSAISFAGFSVAGWQVSAGDKYLVVDP